MNNLKQCFSTSVTQEILKHISGFLEKNEKKFLFEHFVEVLKNRTELFWVFGELEKRLRTIDLNLVIFLHDVE